MKALQGIKIRLASYFLRKKLKNFSRRREIKNIANCKSALIICDYSEDPEGFELDRMLLFLKKYDIDTFVLNFKESKDINESQISNIQMFGLIHLNQLFIPIDKKITALIEKEFDLLIDLSIRNKFTLKYIHSLSCSRFKVGASGNYKNEFADLTIDISKNQNLSYLITQLKHYLTLINKEEHVAQF